MTGSSPTNTSITADKTRPASGGARQFPARPQQRIAQMLFPTTLVGSYPSPNGCRKIEQCHQQVDR